MDVGLLRNDDFAVPGIWNRAESTADLETQIRTVRDEAGVTADEFLGLHSSHIMSTFSPEKLSLRTAAFSLRHGDQRVCDVRLLWLDSHGLFPPVLLRPGLDLDSVLVSLREQGVVPDLRDQDACKAWAALRALVATPPCYPLPEGRELPLPQGSEALHTAYPESYWREWRTFGGPAGPMVEMVMIEGNDLMRRSMRVPNDGSGAAFLGRGERLASRTDWVVPRYIQYSDGTWSAFRVVGVR